MTKLMKKNLPKHIPERTCRVCHKQFPKKDLIRIVRMVDTLIKIDTTNQIAGRGVYVCRVGPCRSAVTKPKIQKALSHWLQSPIPQEILDSFQK